MAGVLFVVHIPSARYERQLREHHMKPDLADDATTLTNQTRCSSPRDIVYNNKKQISRTPVSTPNLNYRPPRPRSISQESLTETNEKSTEEISINMDSIDNIEPDDSTLKIQDETTPKNTNENTNLLNAPKKFGSLNDITPTSSRIKKSWEGFKELVSSARKEPNKKEHDSNGLNLDDDSTMEEIMSEIIRKMKIDNAGWVETNKGKGYQITFSILSGTQCDDTIRLLSEWGVGETMKSTVSVIPCTLYTDPKEHDTENFFGMKEGAWNRFVSSVRARLNVAQIVEEVKSSATMTFDFVTLVIVASILAAFGLVEDSTLFLAASMLISPLMGPIIAAIFGTVIKDNKLQRLGVVNELIGIFIATFVGFIFGIIVCALDPSYSAGNGITNEMLSRCEIHSLFVGILIALPSGAAVAIAILGENIGSLVGVAISASLLPPAVNAGLMWALACIHAMFKGQDKFNSVIRTNFYSNSQLAELFVSGSISMCLTITNVISIFLMGVLFLKIKEVAPIVSRSQKQFWKHDIKIARDYNKTLGRDEASALNQELMDELANIQHHAVDQEQTYRGVGAELLRKQFGSFSHHQQTWSPMSARHHFSIRDSRPSIHELEALLNLAGQSNLETFTHNHHHQTPHVFNKFPGTFRRATKNWSSPKHIERLSPSVTRRSSIPVDNMRALRQQQNESLRAASAPLSKIMENRELEENRMLLKSDEILSSSVPQSSCNGVNSDEKRSKHGLANFKKQSSKFTVTPVDLNNKK
uniref:Putative conserved plasma membrane protein n=1 Tax=Corethrella appendiculata TaxID=1370023 RepID=U5EUZ1_9DIPT